MENQSRNTWPHKRIADTGAQLGISALPVRRDPAKPAMLRAEVKTERLLTGAAMWFGMALAMLAIALVQVLAPVGW